MLKSCKVVKAAAITNISLLPLLEVKVRSQETIKPWTPTAPHRRNFKLSLLDLFLPPEYPSFIYFYPPPPSPHQHLIRDSLSKSLSRFYTFAGRIHRDDPATVDCNDQGVLYTEAEVVNAEMRQLLSSPHPKLELLHHLAAVPMYYSSSDRHLAAVRVNLFQCGGIALSVAVNHQVADACTVEMWLKAWAAIASGNLDYSHDDHRVASNVGASLFPANQAVLDRAAASWNGALYGSQGAAATCCSTKRFVFDPVAISSLQSRVAQTSGAAIRCSQTQAILGLVWKCSSRAASSPSSVAFSYVNVRPRFNKPLPEYSVGNFLLNAVARYQLLPDGEASSSTDVYELKRRVDLLRRSVREVDGELLEKMTGEDGHEEILKWQEKVNEMCSFNGGGQGMLRHYNFTSAIGMGLNQIDFGWGRPLWFGTVAHTDEAMKNCVALVKPTPGSEAVDAWVSLDSAEMAVFERDPELLQYATINPAIVI